jgi:hypothetical protein
MSCRCAATRDAIIFPSDMAHVHRAADVFIVC